MNYKIFLISERGQGSGVRDQGLAPEGGQAAKVSVYEKDCSNAKFLVNLIY